VRDAYYATTGSARTDVWLMLGDNGYPVGDDVNYQYAIFEDMFEPTLRTTALWPTFGNHDWGDGVNDAETGTGPYFDMHTLPTKGEAGGAPSGTEGYYSFDYANIHFLSLETIQLKTPEQIAWIEQDLAGTTQPWVIAFFHVPPYTKGSHDSDELGHEFARQGLAKTLEEHGVDLVLSGHSHNYERSMLIDGQYGLSSEFSANPAAFTKSAGDGREDGDGVYAKPAERGPHQGTVYVVSGKSGDRPSGEALDHPVMVELTDPYTNVTKHGLAVSGSLVLEIEGSRLDAHYLNENGKTLDHFSIVKGASASAGGGSGDADASDDGGCGCHTRSHGAGWYWPLLAALALCAVRRRVRLHPARSP
jgi:MYXO-CTERM domain-containing protein